MRRHRREPPPPNLPVNTRTCPDHGWHLFDGNRCLVGGHRVADPEDSHEDTPMTDDGQPASDLPQFGETDFMWSMYPPGENRRPGRLRRWWLKLTDRLHRSYDWPVKPNPSGRGILIRDVLQADLDAFYNQQPESYDHQPDFTVWWDKNERTKPTEEWVWCSFTDPDRPEGDRFLGVVITTTARWAMGLGLFDLNPGGEIAMVPIPDDMLHKVPPEYRNRILTREEAEAL